MNNTTIKNIVFFFIIIFSSTPLLSQSQYQWYFNDWGYYNAFIGSGSEGMGFARFYNQYGEAKVYIGCGTNGVGLVWINGRNVHDYAEVFELLDRTDVIPGTVMSMHENGDGLILSNKPYDKKVVGVISGAGGLTTGYLVGSRQDDTSDLPVAVSGQVYVRVCVEGGEISVGDLLVSSSLPGVSMRASDINKTLGRVIGKALEPYKGNPGEEGLVRMLVMNH